MKHQVLILMLAFLAGCNTPSGKIPVILDTDANNELDDQHAIAYLIFNDDIFDIQGITTNRTRSGGMVEEHTREAERIVKLCHAEDRIQVISGANGTYQEIQPRLNVPEHDGHEAVNFIIETAHQMPDGQKLLLLPVGKLTNIALALVKDPGIIEKVKVAWLGSNWPDPGEYNLVNDTSALNPVISSGVECWICTVTGGTREVKTTRDQIIEHFAGRGKETSPIEGRHGGTFTRLGDYLVELWMHMDETRSLFDMAAVANVKNPDWAEPTVAYGVRWSDGGWVETSTRTDSVTFFRNYDTEAIMNDFWMVMERMGE